MLRLGHAQEVVEQTWKYKGKSIPYVYHQGSDSTHEVILAFADTTNQGWQVSSWVQELSWLSTERQALLVGLSPEVDELSTTFYRQLLKENQLTDQKLPLSFIALGSGAESLCSLVGEGVSGVFIAQNTSCSFQDMGATSSYGILNSRDNDSARIVRDSLSYLGHWVKEIMVIGDDPYYVEQRKEVILQLFQFNDSITSLLQDSASLAALKNRLVNTIPEILRQGQVIPVELQVAEQGLFKIELLDLSGKAVLSEHRFLGKGLHKVHLQTKALPWGVYKLVVDGPKLLEKRKIMIRG